MHPHIIIPNCQAAVGEGIAASGIRRDELYLASKVWTTTIHKGPEAVQAQLEKTLADLKTGETHEASHALVCAACSSLLRSRAFRTWL